ncbi:MAG: ParM/StbA family protein [Candidatus Micrarchaeaceae archaeon]
MSILATDIGYGHTKYAFENVLNKFPTLLAPVKEYSGIGNSLTVTYNGRSYVVGEAAKDSIKQIPSVTQDFLVKYSPIFLYEIMKSLGFPEISKIYVSLSISEFKNNCKALEKACSKFIANDTVFSQPAVALPQGLGIWYACGKPKNALIVDIGYNTIDVLTIKNSAPQPADSFGILDTGVITIANDVSEMLSERFNHPIDLHFANTVLMNNGKFKFDRREYDVSDDIDDLKSAYTERMLAVIFNNQHIKHIIRSTDMFIIAGGGAYFIDETIKQEKSIYIPDQPEYANVLGFIQFAKE